MRCKYASEADAFMKKIRGQMAEAAGGTSETEKEEEKELEAGPGGVDNDAEENVDDDGEPKPAAFERIKTGRSIRPRDSTEDFSTEEFTTGPYDIDRVNTRDSFKRTASRTSSRHSKSRRS